MYANFFHVIIDIAEEVLNKCTVYDPNFPNPGDENYTVYFDYEFVNDFTLHGNRYRYISFSKTNLLKYVINKSLIMS